MKLDHDCVRDTLLYLEENMNFLNDGRGNLVFTSIELATICDALPKYPETAVFYAIYNLEQAGYLDCTITYASGGIVYSCRVNRITYAGHEFLDRIRDETRWAGTKKVLASVRDFSLDAITAVASGMTAAAIDGYFKQSGTNLLP